MDRRAFLGGGAGLMAVGSTVQAAPDTPEFGQGQGLRFLSKDEFAKKLANTTRSGNPPPSASVKALTPPVGNQGAQGSCVGWSVGYGLGSTMLIRKGRKKTVSPAYIYNRGMLIDSIGSGEAPNCSNGMFMETALSFLVGFGAIDKATFDYDPASCSRLPSFGQDEEARKQKVISDWQPALDIEVIKGALVANLPTLVALNIRPSFFQHRGGTVYRASATEPLKGGHAMLVVGYDNSRGAFELMNSWGTGWGNLGFAWIDYETIVRDATVDGALRMYTVSPS